MKIINIPQPNLPLQKKLAAELGISPVLAQVLINRGIKSSQEAQKFLEPELADLLSPFQMQDMQRAVARVMQAAQLSQKVLIFGDYDVDGLTSVALLKACLERLGITVLHYIPHRINEGYGLNLAGGKFARKNGVKLIISVDCGINSCQEVDAFRNWGIDVIITDHHQPQPAMPNALAIINPKRRDCPYPYKELAGVGVAYKFAQAISASSLCEDLDLVAIGTIADSAALNGENRIIARHGLKMLPGSTRPGIRALIDASGLRNKEYVKASMVSFILGPRINASGRIETAETALSLLLAKSESEAAGLAGALNSLNTRRQKIEEGVLRQANNLVDKEVNFKEQGIIVLNGPDWHLGVLGIVASRITEKFRRPTILISEAGQQHCRGSARSIKDFSILDALLHCQKHLVNFGGHRMACGLTINKDNIPEFRQEINRYAQSRLLKEFLLPSIEVDMEISLSDLNNDLIGQLSGFEPFGAANPEPLFYTRGLSLRGEPKILSRDTLKFWVTDSELTYPVIGFGCAALKPQLCSCSALDLVYRPELDNWQEQEGIVLRAKEIIFK